MFKDSGMTILSKPVLYLAILASCLGLTRNANAACDFMRGGNAQAISAASVFRSNLGLMSAVAAANRGSTVSIVGLWTATFASGGQVFDMGYDQWHSDGTEILNDVAPPQPANGAGTICLGVYVKTGPNTYHLRHPFWSMDANGNLAATGFILEDITVESDGNTYSGNFTFLEYDLDGSLIFEADGSVSATRMTAE